MAKYNLTYEPGPPNETKRDRDVRFAKFRRWLKKHETTSINDVPDIDFRILSADPLNISSQTINPVSTLPVVNDEPNSEVMQLLEDMIQVVSDSCSNTFKQENLDYPIQSVLLGPVKVIVVFCGSLSVSETS